MPENTIGFIGLGIMGAPMAANLRRAGYQLVVHNRTRSKAEEFASSENGDAEVADSPKEVAERTDVVITMLPGLARRRAGVPGRGRGDRGRARRAASDRHELDRPVGGAGGV